MALALAIVTFAEMLRTGGLVPAFIAYREDDEDAQHTVFWLGMAAGVGFFITMFLLAPVAAGWFNAPNLTAILRGLALTQILDSFRTVPFAIMVRDYRFREKSVAESIPMFVAVPVGVVSALLLPLEQRAWSLVVMFLVRYTLSAVLVSRYEPYRPKARFDTTVARNLSAEGRRILLTSIPASALDALSRVGVGARIDVASVGVFNLAGNVTMPATFVAYAANWTLFPIIANNREDTARVERYLLRSLKSVGLLSVGGLSWLALVSPDLLPIVFGGKWSGVIVPTQWLCLATAFRNYVLIATNALMAYKRYTPANVIWWLAILFLIALFIFAPIPAASAIVPAQLFAMAMAVAWLLTVVLTATSFNLSARRASGTVLIPVIPSAVAATAALLTRSATVNTDPFIRLLIETIVLAPSSCL